MKNSSANKIATTKYNCGKRARTWPRSKFLLVPRESLTHTVKASLRMCHFMSMSLDLLDVKTMYVCM